jgi:hypothetical protein
VLNRQDAEVAKKASDLRSVRRSFDVFFTKGKEDIESATSRAKPRSLLGDLCALAVQRAA